MTFPPIEPGCVRHSATRMLGRLCERAGTFLEICNSGRLIGAEISARVSISVTPASRLHYSWESGVDDKIDKMSSAAFRRFVLRVRLAINEASSTTVII